MMYGRTAIAAPDDTDRGARPERLGLAYLCGVVAASVPVTLFALAARLALAGARQTLLGAAAFHGAALLRDALFTFAVALPSLAALGHLLLPTLGATPWARRLDRLALGGHTLGAALLLGAIAAGGWNRLMLLTAGGALVAAGGLVQALGFVLRLARAPAAGAPSPFSRALWTASVAAMAALPVAVTLLALLMAERLTGATLWHGAGADPLLYERWLRTAIAPLAPLAALPCIGAVGEAIAGATRRPLAGARVIDGATWALALLGGVALLARLLGGGAGAAAIASFFALACAAPLALIAGNWLRSLAGGVGPLRPPSWFALAAAVTWAELACASVPLAMLDVGDTLGAGAFAEGHQELLFAALGLTVAAALHRAWPALVGHAYAPRPAGLACALGFGGVQLAVVPQLWAGVRGMPRGLGYPPELRGLQIAAAAGTILWIAAAALVAAYLVASLRKR